MSDDEKGNDFWREILRESSLIEFADKRERERKAFTVALLRCSIIFHIFKSIYPSDCDIQLLIKFDKVISK